jgi:energy-converting hydrogenase Eha subunit G
MKRKLLLAGLLVGLLALQASPVLAQTWTPEVSVSPLREILVTALKWATYAAVIFIVVYAFMKLLYGRALAGSGAPGVASRGYSEKWEAFAGLVWFAVALVLFPFIIYIVARMGLLPPWVATEMSNVIKEIWYWSPGS